MKTYYIYILTNKNKTVLYTGVTNNLKRRLSEHVERINKGFTQKYSCKYLIYFEEFTSIVKAIQREKQIKRWSRAKKEFLIGTKNPTWEFLNECI